MKNHHETAFMSDQLALWRLAEHIVEAIPQRVSVESFRCHEVARIVGDLLALQVQDGKYGAVDHSWCWTEPMSVSWNSRRVAPMNVAILDPYCIGRLPMVQLVAIDPYLPHLFGAYRPEGPREDIDTELVQSVVATLLPMMDIWKRGV